MVGKEKSHSCTLFDIKYLDSKTFLSVVKNLKSQGSKTSESVFWSTSLLLFCTRCLVNVAWGHYGAFENIYSVPETVLILRKH